MARLDKTARDDIGEKLRQRLPRHWRISVGDNGSAYLEVDQDGRKPAHEFHAVGSTVIVIGNDTSDKGKVVAERFTRVPHPPGYVEGRQHHSYLAKINGRGWLDKLVEAVVATAAEADVELASKKAAEA